MVDGGGRQSEEASVILLPSRALTLSVRPGPAQLLVESFTTGAAAPVDVVRSPTDRPTPPPPPLLAQFAPHRRFIALHPGLWISCEF